MKITEKIWAKLQDTFDDSRSGYRFQVELMLGEVPVMADGKVSFYPTIGGQISIVQRNKQELLPEFAELSQYHGDDCGFIPHKKEIEAMRKREWKKIPLLQFPDLEIKLYNGENIVTALQHKLSQRHIDAPLSEESLQRMTAFFDEHLSEKSMQAAKMVYERTGRTAISGPTETKR